ncbi:MAG: hypothetical protein V7767_09960 [Leeuwenhoekiella sp.]
MKLLLLFIISVFVISCKNEPTIQTEVATSERINSKYGCAPEITDTQWYLADNKAPLFKGLDAINYSITTRSLEAQKYFNQGMVWAYGFNHAEAARSFYYATKLDPDCAMCYFGYAYVLGPNYNAGMENDNYERAYKAIQKAKELAFNTTPKERDFIEVMAIRYTETPPKDRSSLDIAYSKAMKNLYIKYPDDPEISALYAESIMNLHPWDLYEKDGTPKEWTPEITTLLEKLIIKNPKHPGAHHFYIHATEASNNPEKANLSAQVFDNGLVSGSGHLLHMPSHIYIRTGEYHKGTLSNIQAVLADSSYVTTCHAQGAYPLAYYPHNYHFMAATATLEGNSKWAMLGAKKVSEHVHPDLMKEPGWGTLQHYYLIPYYVAVKLGKWDEILNMNLETYDLPYPEAITHYAKGMAYLAKYERKSAKQEMEILYKISKDSTLNEITIWDINTVYPLVEIASKVLKSEILEQENNYDESIQLLKEAVVLEDALNYNEPPDWFFSVRHYLGAAQIESGNYKDAIDTYENDLVKFPQNGWAHHGLKLAYQNLGDKTNENRMDELIKKSWSTADIQIESSRIK